MARAAGAARPRSDGRSGTTPLRPFVWRAFDVWHREQMVRVVAGEVRDPALVETLRGIDDPALLEWRR